jgi:hydroxyacylglutathione hydrolase
MILEVRAVPRFYKNGFLLGCERTREAVVIDPGDEIEDLLSLVHDRQLTVTALLLTHGHVDHVSGAARAHEALGAPIWIHEADLFLYENAQRQGEFFGLSVDAPPPVDHFYDVARRLAFGDYDVRIHHTPGHSPGGVCLQVGQRGEEGRQLFVGDTLFAGSIGRTDLPGGNYETLIQSIRNVLFAFGDAAEVFSGHGPATTIGAERRTNPFVRG